MRVRQTTKPPVKSHSHVSSYKRQVYECSWQSFRRIKCKLIILISDLIKLSLASFLLEMGKNCDNNHNKGNNKTIRECKVKVNIHLFPFSHFPFARWLAVRGKCAKCGWTIAELRWSAISILIKIISHERCYPASDANWICMFFRVWIENKN